MTYTNTPAVVSQQTTSYSSGNIPYTSIALLENIPHSAQLEVERIFVVDRDGSAATLLAFLADTAVTTAQKKAVFIIPISRCTLNTATKNISAINLPASGDVYNYVITTPTPTTYTIKVPILSSSTVTVRRKTVSNEPLVNWVAGSRLTSKQLNLATTQSLYLLQEAIEKIGTSLTLSATQITVVSLADAAVTPSKISTTTDPWSFYGTIQTVAPTANLHATTRLYTLDKFFQHGVMTKDDVAPTSSAVDILETAATAGNSGLWFNPKNGTINLWAGNAWVTVAGTPVTTANLVTTNTVQTLTAAKTFAAGTVVPFTQTGTGAVARTVDAKLKDTVSVKDFGAVGDGVTNDTAAINAALATKKSVYFPSGTYMTTGGHVISYVDETTDQTIFGDAAFSTIIKKISGTLAVFDFRQFVHTSIKDLTIDGNGLAGVGVMWRSHNSIIDHIIIKNVADYAIWVSGSNLCNYYNISTFVCSGGIKFDSANDPISVPSYACLYSNFHGISLDINAVNFSALSLASGMVQLVLFSGVHIEPTFVTANTVSYVNITGVNTSNITFENVRAELSLLGTSFFNITGIGVHSIKFDKCRISATQQSAPLFAANATYGISIIDCSFYAGETLANFPVASPRIKLTNVVNATIQGCITSYKDSFVFIETISACKYITESNNSSLPWVYGSWTVTPAVNGSNTWSDSSLNIKCENGGFAQNHSTALFSITKSNNENDFNTSINRATTIADDSYYDLFGDGGTTNLGSNFLALVTIAAGNQATLSSINNFAMLYISCSTSSGVAFASSMLGSNVEVDLMTTTASLADTTDGKLGVQIGDAVPTTERYVRIYNRTGVALLLNLKIENMDRV